MRGLSLAEIMGAPDSYWSQVADEKVYGKSNWDPVAEHERRKAIETEMGQQRLADAALRYAYKSSPEYLQSLRDQERENKVKDMQVESAGLTLKRAKQDLAAPKVSAPPFAIPSGYQLGPDGKSLMAVRGGPADPETVVNKKPPTDGNNLAYGYALRMLDADKKLRGLTGKYSPTFVNTKRSYENLPSPMLGLTEGLINAGVSMMDPEAMLADQAQRNFINAILRRESGAVISDSEFANANKQYFPQPNDPPELVKQKALNRKLAIQGLIMGSGPLGKELQYEEDRPQGRQGWTLMEDANGNQAYVGPNGEIEEVK